MPNYYSTALPIVGVSSGPGWATSLNKVMTLLENHAHTGSDEQRITPAAININADLTFNGSRATALKAVQLTPATLPTAGATADGLLVDASGNLWYENNTGAQVQITTGGSIVPTGTGANNGFYGDYAGVVAKVNYVNSTGVYSFYKDNLTTLANVTAASAQFAGSLTLAQTLTSGSPTGGWRFVNQTTPNTELTVYADAANNGSYSWPLIDTGSLPNSGYAVALNTPTINTDKSYALTVWNPSNSPGQISQVLRLASRAVSGTGAYTSTFGPYLLATSEYGSAGSGTMQDLGYLQWHLQDPAGGSGAVTLLAWNHAYAAGYSQLNLASGTSGGVGIGGAASIDGAIQMYAPLLPSSTSVTLGNSATPWGTVYTNTIMPTGTNATLTIGSSSSAITVTGNTFLDGSNTFGSASGTTQTFNGPVVFNGTTNIPGTLVAAGTVPSQGATTAGTAYAVTVSNATGTFSSATYTNQGGTYSSWTIVLAQAIPGSGSIKCLASAGPTTSTTLPGQMYYAPKIFIGSDRQTITIYAQNGATNEISANESINFAVYG